MVVVVEREGDDDVVVDDVRVVVVVVSRLGCVSAVFAEAVFFEVDVEVLADAEREDELLDVVVEDEACAERDEPDVVVVVLVAA